MRFCLLSRIFCVYASSLGAAHPRIQICHQIDRQAETPTTLGNVTEFCLFFQDAAVAINKWQVYSDNVWFPGSDITVMI